MGVGCRAVGGGAERRLLGLLSGVRLDCCGAGSGGKFKGVGHAC